MLDVGCGTGVFLRLCADRGASVSGIDATEDLLARARTRVPEADLRLGDMQALPFRDDAFDLVTGFTSFFYADDVVAALREVARVSRDRVVIHTFGHPERCDVLPCRLRLAAGDRRGGSAACRAHGRALVLPRVGLRRRRRQRAADRRRACQLIGFFVASTVTLVTPYLSAAACARGEMNLYAFGRTYSIWQSGRLDRGDVVVLRHGARDARRPQRHVAAGTRRSARVR